MKKGATYENLALYFQNHDRRFNYKLVFFTYRLRQFLVGE